MEMQITTITNRPVFMNKGLEKVTNAILECGNTIQARRYAIAALLAKVQSENLFADDGFSNAAEYACKTFSIEKTIAYNFIKMGQDYVRPVLNSKGKVIGYCSNLLPPADPETQNAPLVDFSTSQIARFMTLGREKVLELVNDGQLSPRMTVKEIIDVVKVNKAVKAIAEAPTAPAEAPTAPTEAPTEAPTAPTATEQRYVPEQRTSAGFDDVPTDWLIAELRLRGFKVIEVSTGREFVIDWKE